MSNFQKKAYVTLGIHGPYMIIISNKCGNHTMTHISLTYPISTFAETTEEPGTSTPPTLFIHHDGLPETTQQHCIGWRTKPDQVGQPIRVAPSNTIQNNAIQITCTKKLHYSV